MVAEEARADHGAARLPHDQRDGRPRRLPARPNDAINHWKADGLDLTPLLTPAKKPHAGRRASIARRSRTTASSCRSTTTLHRPGQAGDRARRAGPRRRLDDHRTPTAPSARCSATRSPSDGATSCCPTTRSTSSSHGSAGPELRRVSGRRASRSSSKATPTTTSARGSPAAGSSSIRRRRRRFVAEDNIIIGNVALYGATQRRGVLPRPRGRAVLRSQQRRARGRSKASATTAAST